MDTSDSDFKTHSRRAFLTGSAIAGASLGFSTILGGCGSSSTLQQISGAPSGPQIPTPSPTASPGPGPLPTPDLPFTPIRGSLDADWTMRRFQEGDRGTNLSRSGSDRGPTLPAVVPGTVLTSLVTGGSQPDPYFGRNRELLIDAGEVSGGISLYKFWYFLRLQVPPVNLDDRRVFLAFRGINYSADVYLNGTVLGENLQGMFLRRRFDITSLLTSGEQVLAVLVTPPDPAGDPQANTPGPVTWPSVCQGGDKLLGQNVTSQFSGGWDFVLNVADRNTGLWDKVELLVTGPLVLDSDPQITTRVQRGADAGQHSADVTAAIAIRNDSNRSIAARVVLEVGGVAQETTVEVAANSVTDVEVSVALSQARLWWPHGHGEQPLYDTAVRLMSGPTESDVYRCQTGLRDIESSVDPKSGGRLFKVNGEPIFIRGGAWTFPDAMLRHSAQDYDHQVHLHQLANFNLIRIWGGGIIERPEFYEACDRYGLLVWQEFPLSADCLSDATFPGQAPTDVPLFIENCLDAVVMLRNHACLTLWVGCNEGFNHPHGPPPEIDRMLRDGIQGKGQTKGLDPKTPYVSWSTQESEGLGPGDGNYGILDPKLFFGTNVNPYAFNPEYGSVGMPVVESLRRFMPESDLADLDHILVNQNGFKDLNRSWYHHQYRPFFSGTDTTADQILIYGRPTTIEEFGEMAQAAQHQQYKALFEGLNARMWTKYTGGVIWRSAPGWTALSGCVYDRYLEPTGGLFGIRQAGKAINVQIDLMSFDVAVVNNRPDTLPAGLVVVVTGCDDKGKIQSALSKTLATTTAPIDPHSTFVAGSVSDIVDTSKLRIFRTELKDASGHVLASNFDWIADTSRLLAYEPLRHLTSVVLSVSGQGRRNSDGSATVTLLATNNADTLAFFNRVTVWNGEALLQPVFASDNFFSLLPTEHLSVDLSFPLPPSQALPTIRLRGWNSSPGTPGDVVAVTWN